jgi:hypothetical protein
LHLSRPTNLVAEVTAQVFGSAQVYRFTHDGLELELHARQSKESGCVLRLEFDQEVDVALRPKPIRKHRPEQRVSPSGQKHTPLYGFSLLVAATVEPEEFADGGAGHFFEALAVRFDGA